MDRQSTLFIVALSLGMWAAGTSVLQYTQWVAQKGYPLTMLTPGMNGAEILQGIRKLHEHYDQIVLIGYPPFIKDVIDEGTKQGMPWDKITIKLLFTGEAVTERSRDYFARSTGMANAYLDALDMYGSADVGLVAHETPLTIYLRRKAAGDSRLLSGLFAADRVPSVNQFNPYSRYFESEQGRLIVTSPSGFPLVRYDTQDLGGILSYGEIEQHMAAAGVDLAKVFEDAGISEKIWKIPVVYLFGRGMFSATIFGIIIYPEYVKYVLDSPRLQGIVTGKFKIATEETEANQQELRLKVELAKDVAPQEEYREKIVRTFAEELPKISTEYNELVLRVGSKAHPVVTLCSFGDPVYFPADVMRKGA